MRRPSPLPRPLPRSLAAGLTVAVLALAACSAGSSPAPASPSPASTTPGSAVASGSGSAAASGAPSSLVVGLGYIPSVQFAQFYLADRAGYYRDAGLQVTLQNKIDPDLITLVGQGTLDIGLGDGTSVIPAVSQGIPIRYLATIYGTNPSIVLAKASSGISKPADLKGKKIGIPGKYGESWITLQAVLDSAGLTPNDVQIAPYPDFGQAVALQQGAVDAATGYANNEPLQLEKAGVQVVEFQNPPSVRLPGPGLIASTATIAAKGDALKRFIAATLRAMDEIAADPQKGLDATIAAVPDLGKDPAGQLAILKATIATWSGADASAPYGTIDRAGWTASIAFMSKLGLVPQPVTVDQLVSSDLLPK